MRPLLLCGLAALALWSCRANFDGQQALPYPCTRDAGSLDAGPQCPGGWICGLEGRCHDPKVPSEYLCGQDQDCVGVWRCGSEGRCVDPTLDALRAGHGTAPTFERLHPKLPGPPTGALVSGYPLVQPPMEFRSLAYVQDSQLQGLFQARVSAGGEAMESGLTASAVPWSGTAPSTLLGDAVLWLNEVGELYSQSFSDGGLPVPWGLSFPWGSELRAVGGGHLGFFVTGGARVQMMTLDSRLHLDTTVVLDGGARVISQLGDLWNPAGPGLALVAATEGTLAVGVSFPASDGGPGITQWRGVPLPSGASARKLTTRNAELIAIELDGAGSPVALYELPLSFYGGGSWALPQLRLGPCLPCLAGEALVDVRPLHGGADPVMEVRCATATGRHRSWFLTTGRGPGSCDSYPETGASSLQVDWAKVSQGASGHAAFAGAHGQLWLGASAVEATPLTLDRPPRALFWASSEQAPTLVAAADDFLFGHEPRSGFGSIYEKVPATFDPLAGVEGRPHWIVTRAGTVMGLSDEAPATVAFLQPPARLVEPLQALVATTRDGGSELVVSSGFTVFAADVTRSGDAGVVELERRLMPMPGSDIRSLTTLRPRADGDLLEGYLLAEHRLYSFTAESARRWESRELRIPDGEPLEVWSDGSRGRVGYADGTVFSLPSRVRIAPSLPEGDQVADYAAVCGQGYALGSRGLYRLDPGLSQSPLGAWTLLDPQGAFPGGRTGDDFGFAQGRLRLLDNDLYVFTRFGTAVRVRGPSTCPP